MASRSSAQPPVLGKAETRSWLGKLLPKLALLGMGIALALLMGECSVRLLGLTPEIVHVAKGRYQLSSNVKIGYEPVPALAYTGKSMDFYDYRGVANSLGYRDVEHERKAAPSTFRILVLGDSIAAGHSIESFDAVFSSVMQAKLRERGLDVEVLNFGVSGYSTEQEVETLVERGLQFSPDLVLVAYCLNDRGRNDGGIMSTMIKQAKGKYSPGIERSWLHKSALFRVLWYRVLEKHREEVKKLRTVDTTTVAASLARLGRLAKKHHFQGVVAIFPELKDLSNYRFQEDHARVRKDAEQAGLEVIDLLSAFRACGKGIARDRYHPNDRGHRCAGEALAAAVEPSVSQSGHQ